MKKILLLLLVTCYSFAQTGTTTAGQFKMTIPVAGANQDSVVVWNGTDKKLKFVGRSTFGSGGSTPNLDQVTTVGSTTSNPFGFDDGAGNETSIGSGGLTATNGTEVVSYLIDRIQFNKGGFSTSSIPPTTPIADVTFEHPAKAEATYYYDTQSEIINANTTAQKDSKYTVVSNATFTDPSPAEGKGYTVFVRNGTATIGGVGYTAGSLVYRFYHSGAWGTTLINSGGGSGTVTDFIFTNANGISGTVTSSTTTPTLELSLGAITPTTVTASSTVTATNIDATNKTDIAGKQDKPQILNLTSDYTLTSSTSAQKLFNVGTGGNGAFDATASTIYEFELFVDLSTLSSTSGFFSFSLTGTATYNNLRLKTSATKTALISGSVFDGVMTSASAYQLTTASIATVGTMVIKGLINVNGAGTIIPTITLSQASAGVVLTNSYCKLTKI